MKSGEDQGVIRPWHDRCIEPGQTWDNEINTQLATADLVLLLVSADFIKSDYIWSHELDVAMKRNARGETSVVPVMLRSVDITDAPFAALQGLPTDLKPVTSWPNRDEAWTDVAKGIRRTVEQIQAKWSRPPTPPPPPLPPTAAPTLPCAVAPQVASGEEGSWGSSRSKDIFFSPGKPTASSSPTLVTTDPLLDRVVGEFSTQVTEAAKARGVHDMDPANAKQCALTLIDTPDQKRILWVDDRPDNNRFEAAALAKLQIEVVAVTSTEAAIARIASDPESFDLVLSDWQRPEPNGYALSAGIHLLRELRARRLTTPVVFYHGSYDKRERSTRRELALSEGAFGEAVMPDELFGLLVSALDPAVSRQAIIKIEQTPDRPRKLRFLAVWDRGRAEVIVQETQQELIAQLIQRSITVAPFRQDIAKTLFELLIPTDLKDILLNQGRVVFILDDVTANYPWELMIDTDQPLCVRMGMIRQRETVDYKERVRGTTSTNVYVVGDPLTSSNYPELPGARKEAELVASLPKSHYTVNHSSQRLGAYEVLNQLVARSYRIIHIAGHGYYNEADIETSGAKAGVVLDNGLFLTAAEIAMLDPIPELVFLNCGYLGQIGGAAYNKTAASISRELIRKGVRAVVAAGWPVRDDAALCFAQAFYTELLAGQSFGRALKEARQKTWALFPESNTWGAYQAYGDPDFRLNRKS